MPKVKPSCFARWLRAQLKSQQTTAGGLARLARISRAGAYCYVSGTRVPSAEVARRLADALGISHCEIPQYDLAKRGRPRNKDTHGVRA
jgi:transcriptional regulator with XRE-family HTH domain